MVHIIEFFFLVSFFKRFFDEFQEIICLDTLECNHGFEMHFLNNTLNSHCFLFNREAKGVFSLHLN